MNGGLNISNVRDFVGAIVRCSCDGNYIEDVVLSADLSDGRVRLHLSNRELSFTNLTIKDKQ